MGSQIARQRAVYQSHLTKVMGENGDAMLRVIFMGIGVVALILFVAWIFRDPIYLMVHQQSPVLDTLKGAGR